MLRLIIFALYLFFSIIPSYAQPDSTGSPQAQQTPGPEFYASYTKILDQYVDLNGKVDYKKLKANRAEFDVFIENLKKLSRQDFDSWNEKDRIALWINAYNALTLKVVLDNYPIKPSTVNSLTFPSNSIRQIVGAWTGFKHEVMGRSLTLDEIAHTILRGEFAEPRVHLALCPAAIGAPKLRREAYLGNQLDAQLANQSKYFLTNPAKFYLEREEKQVLLSPIFDWYSADFAKVYNEAPQFKRYSKEVAAVLQFLSSYLAEEEATYIKARPLKVSFLEYDWNLNDQNPAPVEP